jgi:hypothetical protein
MVNKAPGRIVHGVLLLLSLAASEAWIGAAVGAQGAAAPEPPLARVEVSSARVFREAPRSLFIEAVAGVPLSKLVGLGVFGAFRPGLTIDEATARFGPPVQIRSDRNKRTAVYESPAARIEVVDELSGSGLVSYHRLTLYAYPKPLNGGCGMKAAEALHASVKERVAGKGTIEVGVAEAGDGERVWALVRDGCVEALNWWAPTSQR